MDEFPVSAVISLATFVEAATSRDARISEAPEENRYNKYLLNYFMDVFISRYLPNYYIHQLLPLIPTSNSCSDVEN